MRPSPLLVAVLFGGCTNNPYFGVLPGSDAGTEETGSATATSASDAGSSEASGAGEEATTGEPVEPGTGGQSSSGASASSASSASTADGSTSDASSTGAIDGADTGASSTGAESSSTGGGLFCGDGMQTGDEQCDDGNDEPGDGCENNCRRMFAPVEHSLSVAPHDLAFAEFDGDGVLDVVVGHASPKQGDPDVTVGLGKEDGTFDWDTWDAPGLLGGSALLVGRFVGGDAAPDIVMVPATGASNLTLWKNTSAPGQATLAAPGTIAGPPNTSYIASRSADINQDQRDDLLFVSAAMHKLYLHRNNGVGFAPALSWATAGAPNDLVVGPLIPGDALADVLVAHKDGVDDVGSFKGDGKGAFMAAAAANYCNDGAGAIAVGDADGAGPLDVLVTCQTGGLLVLAGHDGVDSHERTLGPGLPAVVQAGIVDLYGDGGGADVFAVAATSKELLIGVQVGEQFMTPLSIPLEHTPRRLAVGDLNDDEAPDLMLVFPAAARALVLLNQTQMAAPASE